MLEGAAPPERGGKEGEGAGARWAVQLGPETDPSAQRTLGRDLLGS